MIWEVSDLDIRDSFKELPMYVYEGLEETGFFDTLSDYSFYTITKFQIEYDEEDGIQFSFYIDEDKYLTDCQIRYDKKEKKFEINRYDDTYDELTIENLYMNLWFHKGRKADE